MSSYEAARVQACERSVTEAHEQVLRAQKTLVKAEREFDVKHDEHVEASAKYATTPTDDLGGAILRARDARDVAQVPFLRARQEVGRSHEAVRVAETALADARAALEALERAEENAALHRAASVETFEEGTRDLWAAIVEHYSAIQQAAAGITLQFAASHSASAKLRDAGDVCSDLGNHHLLSALLRQVIAASPEKARAIMKLLDSSGGISDPWIHRLAGGLGPVLAIPVLDQTAGAAADPLPNDDRLAELRAFLQGRTLSDALAAVNEVRAGQELDRQAPQARQSPGARILGRVAL